MDQTVKTFIKKLRFNESGLIPAIAQDWLDGSILMLAWMNEQAIEKTLDMREVHYWSRSRNELWHKGSTSGNIQILKGIRYDCDCDSLLISVEQTGQGACHTGEKSCFFQLYQSNSLQDQLKSDPPEDSCGEVFKIIKKRKINPKSDSYTNFLFEGKDNRILKKIGEESSEFIMACKDNDSKSISNEAADLIFHLQVALAHHEVEWKEVLEVLANRRNQNIQE